MPQPKLTDGQSAKARKKGETVRPMSFGGRLMTDKVKALSEFADYVHKQQSSRRFGPPPTSIASKKNADYEEVHDELAALDSLDLADSNAAPIRLKSLLLDTSIEADHSLEQLKEWVHTRLVEGNGEGLLDL